MNSKPSPGTIFESFALMATKPIPFGWNSFASAMSRSSYPFENGHSLQVKTTAVPFAPLTLSRECILPSVPFRLKAAPCAPIASSSAARAAGTVWKARTRTAADRAAAAVTLRTWRRCMVPPSGFKCSAGERHSNTGPRVRLQRQASQSQSVPDHRHRRDAHGGAGQHRAQQDAGDGIEDSRRDRHGQDVVDEREEQVLADV